MVAAAGTTELAALFEELLEVALAPHRASPVEAPRPLTDSYIQRMFAYGFARLGFAERARSAKRAADVVFEELELGRDSVHPALSAAFDARLDGALLGRSNRGPLPAPVVDQWNTQNRIFNYKVSRLREASWILWQGHDRPPANKDWSEKRLTRIEFQPDLVRENAETTADELTARLARKDDGEPAILDACLDALLTLPEGPAMSLLVDVVDAIDRLDMLDALGLHARAVDVASQFGRGELATRFAEHVIAALVNVPGPQMLAPLEDLVVALRRLELVEVLREVVASVERDRPMSPQLIELEGREPDVRPLSRQLVLAGALATIGDPRGAELLERACATLPTSRVAHCHEVARCLAVAPTELATAGLRRLSRELATTTDSWGTNSHYCRSRLQVVDGLVLGACESWRGRLPRAA